MASISMAQDARRCDLCSPDTGEGSSPAEIACKSCNINMCKVCMIKHVEFHQTLPSCNIHQQACELNCQDCNVPICSKCVIAQHKNHNMAEISEIFKFQVEIMKRDNEELENVIIPTYGKINAEYEKRISTFYGEYANLKRSISKHGQQLHKLLDIVIRNHLSRVEKMEKDNIAILQQQQSEINQIQMSAQELLQKNKNSVVFSDTIKVINYVSTNIELKKIPQHQELFPPTFAPGIILEETLCLMLGQLNPSVKTEVPGYTIQSEADIPLSPPVKQLTGKPKSITCIGTGFNQASRVSCLPNKDQVFIKDAKSNVIKHLDNKGKLLKKIATKSGNAADINLSVSKDGRLVYSDRNDRTINIVTGDKVETIVRLMKWKPWAVFCSTNNDLLVTMMSDNGNNKKVVRYAGSTVRQEIQFDESGKALYSSPQFIAENGNLDICVSNWYPHEVIVVDKSGNIRFRYDGSHSAQKHESFCPSGLATDSCCRILVTDQDNHCVHILNHDGGFLRYIDNCNLRYPCDLSINAEDLLYVADATRKVKLISYLQ